jgi:hypothetical protein
MKYGKMRWAVHVARMGKGEAYSWFWWGNLRERGKWEDLGIDVRIILRCISKVGCVGWLRIGIGGGLL